MTENRWLVAGMILSAMFLGCAPGGGQNAVNLADVKATQIDKNWSDVKTDGAVTYRLLAKGGEHMVKVPAWWPGNQLRPAENTQYVMEVTYKDVATTPIVAFAYGGLSRGFGPSEVHRFGGFNDGKWKTANVPIGWDQLMRYRDEASKDMTAVGFNSDADLPIASLKFRPAAAADQERYNAQTRDWVARIQAQKRDANPLQVEPARFDPAKRTDPMVAYSWPALVPLLPGAQPKDAQIGAPIKIRMCENELEGGSFGVYANADLTGVNYTVSPLVGAKGKLAGEVIPRTAEYALVQQRGGKLAPYPQRLWPAFAVDIPKGQSHWFLFNIRSLRGRTQPGLYKGQVTITAAQGKATLPVEVEVLPVDLLTMDEAKLFMGGCVSGLLPVHDFAFSTQYNQNGINLWYSGVAPEAKVVNDKLVLDYTVLDEWMTQAAKRGLVGNVWFLGGDPYGFASTMTIYRSMGTIDTHGGATPPNNAQWIAKYSTEELRDKPPAREHELVADWVRQVSAHAKEKGWPEVILTPFDEPAKWVQKDHSQNHMLGTGPWIKTWFEDGVKAIREGNPNVRIYGSIHHIDRSGQREGLVFLPMIDIFCTCAIHEDPTVGDKVRAAGKTFWQYGGGDQPDHARFGYGFYHASFGSVGALRWAYNWGPGFDTTDGANWMYAWETPFDVIPSPSYEGMREAWDDRRVIETYKRRFANDPEAMAVLHKILAQAAATRTGQRETVADFYTAIDDLAKVDAWRNALLDRLAK